MSELDNKTDCLNQSSINDTEQQELYEYFKDILEDNVNTV